MEVQDIPPGVPLLNSNIPANQADLTSPKSRKKRVAINSPDVTPTQTTSPTAMDVDKPYDSTTIQPTVLAHRFLDNTPHKPMTPALVKATVASDDWKEVWDHPQILAELTAEPLPPTPGEVLPYEFDQEDTTTIDILHTINGSHLEGTMRDHVLATKNQDRSRMHPRLSPFTLQYHEKDTGKAIVVNSKGDRAYTFKIKDIKLEREGTNFDLNDRLTYSTLCTLHPALLWGDLQETMRDNQLTTTANKGPFKIELNNDATKSITFLSQDGVKWTSTLSTEHKSTAPHWEAVSRGLKRPTPQTTHADQPNTSLTSRKSNRFSILADNTDTTSPSSLVMAPTTSPNTTNTTQQHATSANTPSHIEITKQDSISVDDNSDGETTYSAKDPSPQFMLRKSPSNTAQTTNPALLSGLSSLSDPHAQSDGTNGQYLINVELQLTPGQEHIDTLCQKTRELLKYIQQADPTAAFLSRTSLPNGSPNHSLTSPTDSNWPTMYLAAQNWFYTSMDYLFKLPPITEKQLQSRLAIRQRKDTHGSESQSTRTKPETPPVDKGPVAIYLTMRLRTSIPQFDSLLTSTLTYANTTSKSLEKHSNHGTRNHRNFSAV